MHLHRFTTHLAFLGCLLAFSTSHADSDDRRIIAAALFGIDYEDVPALVNHNYNSWGQNPGLYSYYQGGHGGLDVQTKSVASTATADETFFAVSRGEVIAEGAGTAKTIAIYDSELDITTLYLHARRVFDLPDFVEVGDPLGIQGDSGASGAEHIHLEVRTGRRTSAGNGANFSVNPEPYLVNYVEKFSPSARILNAKLNHWAKNETRNAIHLGIFRNTNDAGVTDDRAWLNLDRTATRGELVTILRRAALALNPAYFDNLPNVNTPPFFFGDTSLASSSHRESVELFAQKGFVAVTNTSFNVNGTVTQGEAVLMIWRLLQLGTNSTASAIDAYKAYRAKLRTVPYQAPRSSNTFLLPNSTQSQSFGYARQSNGVLLKENAPGLFTDATGIVSLTFPQGSADVEREGYSLPAKRGLIAKMTINSLLFRLTHPTNWQAVMDAPRPALP